MNTFQRWEGCGERYCISEFSGFLQKPDLSSQHNLSGWVFWNPKPENELWNDHSCEMIENEEKQRIRRVVEAVNSSLGSGMGQYMVQFWGMKEGGSSSLTTVDQPFAVGALYKGYSWYRKFCEAHQYSLKEEFGTVGRVYLNREPESSPDLRLYSDREFPLRKEAARCGLRTYLAVPVLDSHTQKCYGVLEIVSCQTLVAPTFSLVDQGLMVAELRSTHMGFSSIIDLDEESTYHQPEGEIQKMMISAMELVPQLHLVQVWSPCKQCVKTSNNLSCMQRIAFIEAKEKTLNSCIKDLEMYQYLEACEFHHLQIGKCIGRPLMSADRKSCFCRNICDFSICENPLAHYAQQARLSCCFVVHLQNEHRSSNNYLVEFFFQSNSRQDASFLHLVLKIMKKELTNFNFEESIFELRKTSGLTAYSQLHSEEVSMPMVMKGYRQRYSLFNFKQHLQTPYLSCLQPSEGRRLLRFWREEISDNESNNIAGLPNILTRDIEKPMMEILTGWVWRSYSLVQIWAVGMNEGRLCLQTSNQPFALGDLHRGLAFFRKKCMEQHYFLDEEVGPLQRVFRSGHPETSPDLRLYSTSQFPLRDDALYCHLRTYIAVPIFDKHKKCTGVLECVGGNDDDFSMIDNIERALEAASLYSTHINLLTGPTRQVNPSRRQADTEIFIALELFKNIPQLYHSEVWVTYNGCEGISSNIGCMELFQPLKIFRLGWLPNNIRQVQTGKGIVGMVLASENKSCFCRNLCDFSIADQPLAHYSQRDRVDACFAICLKSSHTGDLLYVIQFFLYQGPANYEYISSFLRALLPILKQQLTSFKVASGQQLGDDLVVDVIEFPQENQHNFSGLDELYSSPFELYSSPFKFKTVVYGEKETQHSNDELHHFVPDVMDSVPPEKPSNNATSDSKEKDVAKEMLGRKRNSSLQLNLENIQPHFGKTIDQAAEELGVGVSTLKRACRSVGIKRWPNREAYIKNPSLFEAAGTPSTTSDILLLQNLPPTNAKTTQQLQSESDSMMVKVKHEDEIIKFKLCLSSTMNNLLQQVATRLDLETGSFRLTYLDADNDKISLKCDDALQLCLKGLTAMDTTTMQLFVHLISKFRLKCNWHLLFHPIQTGKLMWINWPWVFWIVGTNARKPRPMLDV